MMAQPPLAARTFAFDEDMDRIWAQCCDLVVSHRNATNCVSKLVKPWHLALILLFGDLSKETDRRLYTDQALLSVTPTLELPLFWTAISRVSTIHNRLDEHLTTVVGRTKDVRFMQQLIGQAFWKMVEEESDEPDEPAMRTGDEENPVLSYAASSTEVILSRAKKISEDYVSDHIGSQHVLLALLEDSSIKSVLNRWRTLNVDGLPDAVRKLRPMEVVAHGRPPSFPTLNKWATDLTQIVMDKKNSEPIDPLIGRSIELRRLIAILSKCKKNSAVLLGDPGVGKTAIAEALAQRIVNSEVPESVIARVFSLDLTSILATTQCKLAYEQIMTDILNEVAEHEMRGTRAILFFDNLSQITVGGYQEDGSGLDAASIMKRYFAQGTLRCVGCSTVEDYRDHIEKDGALARRFSPIFVCESTPAETTDILRGLKLPLERFHNVRITDAAFKVATDIATQYFSHKRLPDAALDLIDEACVSRSFARFRTSEEVWKLQRQRVVMEIDIRSLERQLDGESEIQLDDMRYALARHDEKIADTTSLKRYRRRLVRDLKDNDEHRAAASSALKTSNRAEKVQIIDAIEDLEIGNQELKKKLATVDSGEMTDIPDEAEKVHSADPVTVREVAVTASYYTFIPAAKGCDLGNVNVDVELASVVVGQPKAIDAVSGVMQSLWAGLKNPRRPIASLLFGGPAGSGKTLLVKELAKFAARRSGKLITIHASDYTQPHNITRLIGTPACTGFDKGGQLTECLKRKPFSVVYIKEIEHGCPEFLMLIQTILDEGMARDGDGHFVDFTNCIIILSTALGRTNAPRFKEETQHRKHYEEVIHRHLPGEFLARVDNIVIFRPATGETLIVMIDARLEELRKQLATIDLELVISDCARDHMPDLLVQEGIRTAQRMERWIRSHIILPLTTLLLTNAIPQNAVVDLDLDDSDELSVRLKEGVAPTPSSPASSYYSLSPAGEDEAHSDIESNSSESEYAGSKFTQLDHVPVVRSGLQVQPQRLY